MNNPLISVIVPVYNMENHLEKCLNSLLAQTYQNIEILIINDGSTDRTAQIIASFSDERIRVFHQENKGVAFSRNLGLERAKGDYICFVDGDDFVSEKYCEKLHQYLVDYQVDISVCRFVNVVDNQQKIQRLDNPVEVYSQKEALSLIFQDKKLQSYNCGKLFKREVMQNISFPTNRKSYEDYLTIYRFMANSQRVVLFDEALYYYVFQPNSLCNNIGKDRYYEFFSASLEIYNFAKNYPEKLPNWKKIIEKTAKQTLSCIKKVSIYKKDKTDFELIQKMKNEITKFYLLEKNNISISYRWKFFLLLKAPFLYEKYISFKRKK